MADNQKHVASAPPNEEAPKVGNNKNRNCQIQQTSILKQLWRAWILLFCVYVSVFGLHIQQFLGGPLYWINKEWYYNWQAWIKFVTSSMLLAVNQWRAPAKVTISGDASVHDQIKQDKNSGKVTLDFPDRLMLVSNHQLYTDWTVLWWSAYSARGLNGRLFIILKDQLKYIPILGVGIYFFSWIYVTRNWTNDRARFKHRIAKLADQRSHAAQAPMWMLIFPEGTTLCGEAHAVSKRWAKKNDLPDLQNLLLPRTRGLQFCLEELEDTVDWLYDATIAYEGVPPGQYGEDIFTPKRLYLEGYPAPATHIHWRRFEVADIPRHDAKAFDRWLYDRWVEKEELLEEFKRTGKFPAYGGRFCTTKIALDNLLWDLWGVAYAITFASVLIWSIWRYCM